MPDWKAPQPHSFWNDFAEAAPELAAKFRANDARSVFDEVDALLQQHGMDFCFDITANEQTCLLILSPEGDHRVAQEIDELIAATPTLPDWQVFGRRQRKDLSDVRAILWQLYLIDLQECRFPRAVDESQRIQIFVPDAVVLTPDILQGFGNTLLWHALSEDVVMQRGLQAEVQVGIPTDQQTLSAHEWRGYEL